jgi:ABC-type Fe3+-siderophore transport system permease subunit
MIEFGSLSVCGLTLWSGLVFFLNDQKPRMSRFWTEVFSIVLAAVNVMCIVTMIVKYILAVVKEAHTRTAISVWAGKFFNFFFLDSFLLLLLVLSLVRMPCCCCCVHVLTNPLDTLRSFDGASNFTE